MHSLRLPHIIDVEASGFGGESYPIEVGVALSCGQRYCSLISPIDSWAHWDPGAERIHRISRSDLLESGKAAWEVANELNQIVRDQTLYSDGWVVDEPWIIRLYDAAKIKRRFKIYDIQTILTEAQMDCWHDVKSQVETAVALPRHRASNDAFIIQETFRRTRLLTQTLAARSG